MYVVFKQVLDNQSVYSYRNKTGNTNAHIKHVGNDVYINAVHPEVLPMHKVADGFPSAADAKLAIEHFVQIDKLRGIDSWAATPATPALRYKTEETVDE